MHLRRRHRRGRQDLLLAGAGATGVIAASGAGWTGSRTDTAGAGGAGIGAMAGLVSASIGGIGVAAGVAVTALPCANEGDVRLHLEAGATGAWGRCAGAAWAPVAAWLSSTEASVTGAVSGSVTLGGGTAIFEGSSTSFGGGGGHRRCGRLRRRGRRLGLDRRAVGAATGVGLTGAHRAA